MITTDRPLRGRGEMRERERGARNSLKRRCPEHVSSIFVGGIGRNCGVMEIKEQLNQYGTIVDIYIPKKQGVPRASFSVRS